jgi:hypothetical protein
MAELSMTPFEQALLKAVFAEAERLREEAISRAVKEFESSLREAVLKRAVDLTSFYDLNRDGPNLVLTVRHLPKP